MKVFIRFIKDAGDDLFFLLPLFVFLSVFAMSDLGAWDMLGHFLAVKSFGETVFPSMVGWSFKQLAGYPQGYLYPSLFHWVVVLFSKVIPLEVAFKFVISLSTVYLFLIIRLLGNEIGRTREEQRGVKLLLLFFYFFPKGPIGGDFFSTFVIGLVNQAWGMPLYLHFLLYLIRGQRDRNNSIKAGLFFGLIVLSHAFVMLASCFTLFGFWISSRKRFSKHQVLHYSKIAIIGFLIGAAWLLPYLSTRMYGSGVGIPYSLFFFLNQSNLLVRFSVGLFFTAIMLSLFRIRSFFKVNNIQLLATVGVILLVGGGLDLINWAGIADVYKKIPIHFYRLHSFSLILLTVAFGTKIVNRWAQRSLQLAIIAILFFDFSIVASRISVRYNIGFNFKENARILVNQGPLSILHQLAPHQLADSVNLSGFTTINGLFAESSQTAPFVQAMQIELFEDPFIWGVDPAPRNYDLAMDHLRVLGIDTLLTREPLSDKFLRFLPELIKTDNVMLEAVIGNAVQSESFFAYQFANQLVEPIQSTKFTPAEGWREKSFDWWTHSAVGKSHLIEGNAVGALCDENIKPTAKTIGDKIFVQIPSKKPCWVILKESYFPRWLFRGEDGEKLVYRRASPNWIALLGKGNVTGEFEPSRLDRFAQWLSLFSVLMVGVLMMRGRDHDEKNN